MRTIHSGKLSRILLALLFFLLSTSIPVAAQRGALTASQNLSQLMEESAVIVRGHVASAKVEPHPELTGLWTVVITLRVHETMKGQVGETYQFRQYIWDLRDRQDAAGYAKGQELLLFLTAPSPYGLSSPVGLEQGRFRITRDREGTRYAVNGRGNAGLFRELKPELERRRLSLSPRLSQLTTQHRRGPIALDDFRELVRQVAGGP